MVTVSKPQEPSATTASAASLCWKPPLTLSLVVAHGLSIIIAAIMIQAALQFQTKESALAFYAVYHRQPLNQLIHFIGVPGIIFSLLVFLVHIGPVFPANITLLLPGIPKHGVNWATLYVLFYVVFYASIDSLGAVLYFPILYVMYAVACEWTLTDRLAAATTASSSSPTKSSSLSWLGTGRVLQLALLIHVVCWYTQIHWGHQLIEGSTPALKQSLGGALTTAPLFAFYEGVWAAGFQQELHHHVMRLVDQYTKELCQQGAVMRVCEKVLAS